MRVLVTGAGGLLGGRLAELLASHGLDVMGVRGERPGPTGLPILALDLLQDGALERAVETARPEAVVHAAVIGRTSLCEERPEHARAVNAELPRRLARICRERRLRLVALSTDLVFDGERPPYRENDATGPLSVYGRTKREGEQAVLEAFPDAAVVRVALVCGRGHGPSGTCTESIVWALRTGQAVRLFTDEHRTPVDPESIADGVHRLLHSAAAGVFHLGGPERVSRHQLGLRVARLLGLDPSTIVALRQADHAGPDRRAPDVALDSSRARRELGWEPRALDEAIRGGRPSPP